MEFLELLIIPAAALWAAGIIIKKALANVRSESARKRAYGGFQVIAALLLVGVAAWLLVTGRG